MRHLPLAAAGLTALLLASCAVGPRYTAPTEAPVAVNQTTAAGFTSAQPEADWWRQFQDPVLDELERRALSGNLDLTLAVARVREARALFRDTRLDLAPRVTVAGAYTDGRTPQGAAPPLTEDTYQAGLDAAWELDLFGRVRRGGGAAQADLAASQEDLRDAQVLTAAEVARTYFTYRGAQDRLSVAERNLQTQRETLRLTRARFEVGQDDGVGVASVEATLAATEASIPALRIQAAQAAARLAVLAGERPGALNDLLAAPASDRPLIRALPIGDAIAVLRRRADVRAAERRLAGQTARVGVATADLFPRVTVTGFVGFLSGDLSALGGDASRLWSVTPAVSWPGLDIGGARARLRIQEARADAALAEYRKVALQAVEDLEVSLLAYGETQARVKSLANRAAASRRAAELARIRYREGATDFLRLLDAERTLLDAEDAESAALTDLNIKVVGVYKALGGGWAVPAA